MNRTAAALVLSHEACRACDAEFASPTESECRVCGTPAPRLAALIAELGAGRATEILLAHVEARRAQGAARAADSRAPDSAA